MTEEKIKPTVHYTHALGLIEVGRNATLQGVLDHPDKENVSAEHAFHPYYYVTTSRVASYNPETGDFETQNTKYVKVAMLESEFLASLKAPEGQVASQ